MEYDNNRPEDEIEQRLAEAAKAPDCENGSRLIQHRPYGDVIVRVICRCAGCKRLGGVTVEYRGITSIAKIKE